MTGQVSFERAYDALRADPKWQTGFHDPVDGIVGAWNRFLDGLSQVDFASLALYLLLRIILIVAVAWISHKAVKRWLFPAGDWWKRLVQPRQPKSSVAAAPEAPEQPVDPVTLVAEADRLAGSGRFLDALSALFRASIAAANYWATRPIGVAVTVGEIAERNIAPRARDALGTIGRAFERGRFGGAPINAAIYQECREACEGLIDGRSWRE